MHRLATTYAAFLNYAFDRGRSRFRNFLGFDRRWLEEVGSDDCHGRALWALGACVGRSRRRDLQFWASQLFDLALPAIPEIDLAPRLGLRPDRASATTSSGSAATGRPARCAIR